MDDTDRATELEERQRAQAEARRKPSLPIIGICYNCDSECHGVFCSRECRDDYEHREELRRRNPQ